MLRYGIYEIQAAFQVMSLVVNIFSKLFGAFEMLNKGDQNDDGPKVESTRM
jgi:hypothetical protein